MRVLFRFYPVVLGDDKSFYLDLPELPQVGDLISSDLFAESIQKELVSNQRIDLTDAPFTYVRGRRFVKYREVEYLLGLNPNRFVCCYLDGDKKVFTELSTQPRVDELFETKDFRRQISAISHNPLGYFEMGFYKEDDETEKTE